MALTELTGSMNNIQSLPDLPSEDDGITSTAIKVLFDKASNDIKTYINSVLLAELQQSTIGSSGACNIGAEELLSCTNVMDILKAIVAGGTGSIPPDGTISIAKLVTGLFSTDGTMASNSDTKMSSEKAIKTYADTKIPSTYLDTDGTLTADSDSKIATQKAVKTYTMPISYLDTDTGLTANSDLKLASQKATKTYVDTKIPKSIGTTKGDIITFTADSTPARKGVGTSDTILKTNHAGDDIEYGVVSASGTFSNATQSISGSSDYTLQVPLVKYFNRAIVTLEGKSNGTASELTGAIVMVTTTDADARAIGSTTDGARCIMYGYSTSSRLTESFFESSATNIYLKSAVINGTNLDLTFTNTSGVAKTLYTKGTWEAFV